MKKRPLFDENTFSRNSKTDSRNAKLQSRNGLSRLEQHETRAQEMRKEFREGFFFSVATPAEPRGEKKNIFVQISGGEKLLKFVEKCR